ncbi:cytochrome P450 [Maritimibacter sp. DP1N21-5]|uniref:cytochrome P450 n=1 Tax=Maritimibacter sp. DP1N21-5 TaxID=2836867 RepID=UPI001C4521BB|nr:cytochrome P450 [Maritimibacter sp. DP1N21-5]MBV7407860.1 cytochrome P450 [Maritimibacter sp. DP1N21-5]
MELIEGHRVIVPAKGIPTLDIDPFDEAVLADPFEYFDALRGLGPVVYVPRYSMLAVGQYGSTHGVFTDHAHFVSSRGVGLNDFKIGTPWRPPSIILEVDPPDHTKTRRVMARALSPKVVKDLAQTFATAAEALVDEVLAKGRVESVTEIAERFPLSVFPQAVGLREVHDRYLVDYGNCVFNAMGPDNRLRREAIDYTREIAPWIMAACARDRLTPDGIGAAIYADADAGEITEGEAAMLVRSLLSAGVDTTVSGIGNALFCFAENPVEWDKLRADPSLIKPAFEEVLRYSFPVHTFGRTAGVDTEISGHPVEEGTKILAVIGAANRDPEKWGADADQFRVDRRPVGQIGFGAGIHGCVGQNIARGETAAILTALAAKVKRIEFDGAPVWRPSNAIHALDCLPLRFVPA